MRSSHRIVLNTVVTYARSVVAIGLALFSGRWVLNALGETDLGLFSVVGSIIVLVTFLSNAMAVSSSRHFAFAIGQQNPEEITRWFNAAVSIHLGIAAFLVLVGWPIGEYAIGHLLTIPDHRVSTCLWVFRISLVSAFVSMGAIPFVAMFKAWQYMTEPSVWGMLTSLMTFTLAYTLDSVLGDRLLFYAIGMVTILVTIQAAQVVRAMMVFRECRIVLVQWFDRQRAKEIFSFAIWNLISSLGCVLRDQGSAVLLNLFFGPRVNAAYGIANQVSGQTNQLASAMLGAFGPEITASESRGERERMIDLSLRACKFGTLLIMLFAIPLMAEMHYVLRLWLRHPPQHTAIFCQLILCVFLVDRLTAGYMLAVNAHGRIAAYQATVGTTLVLTLPLEWLLLKLGCPPASVGLAFIATMTGCSAGRLFLGWRLLAMPASRWVKAVAYPCLLVAGGSGMAAMLAVWFLPSTFLRLMLTTASSASASVLIAWFLALDAKERQFMQHSLHRVLDKLSGAKARMGTARSK